MKDLLRRALKLCGRREEIVRVSAAGRMLAVTIRDAAGAEWEVTIAAPDAREQPAAPAPASSDAPPPPAQDRSALLASVQDITPSVSLSGGVASGDTSSHKPAPAPPARASSVAPDQVRMQAVVDNLVPTMGLGARARALLRRMRAGPFREKDDVLITAAVGKALDGDLAPLEELALRIAEDAKAPPPMRAANTS